MELLGVASTTLLSSVLLVAGVAKARDRAGTRRAVEAFGLPAALAGPASCVVPALEIGLGLAVWLPATRAAAGWCAASLLVAFSVAVGSAMVRGRAVACSCFGTLDDREVDGWTLVRNAALVAAAATSAVSPVWPTQDPERTVALVVVPLVLLAAVVVALVRMLLDLSRDYATVLATVEAAAAAASGAARPSSRIAPDLVPAGTPLTLELTTTADDPVPTGELFGAPATLLVLADPGCRACTAMLPQLALWATEHPEVPVVVTARVPMRKAASTLPATSARVVVDREHTAHRALGRPGLPAAVVVADDGRTASAVAAGADAVLGLLEQLGSPPALGAMAVHDGDRRVPLAEVVGDDADLLFVLPSCSHCQRLAGTLAREGTDLADPDRRRRVVVVSSGTPEATQALGIESALTVYDLDGSLLAASRAPGTPSLVTMAAGRPTGSVVAGAPAVAEALAHRATRAGAAGAPADATTGVGGP